jgi:hypothetical protein
MNKHQKNVHAQAARFFRYEYLGLKGPKKVILYVSLPQKVVTAPKFTGTQLPVHILLAR